MSGYLQRANLTPCNALSRALGKAMRRRSRAGGEPAKSQRRKTTMPERRNASKAVRRDEPSVVDLPPVLERRLIAFPKAQDKAL